MANTKPGFIINPCQACFKKLRSKGECNLHQLSDCFAETAAAFTGVPSNDSFRGKGINESWQGCISKLAASMGRSQKCELRMYEPPIFVDTPHYYPDLLASTRDKKQALEGCLKLCSNEPNKKEACKEACYVDNDVVIEVLNKGDQEQESGDKNTVSKKHATQTGGNTSMGNKLMIVGAIVLSLSLVAYLYKKNKERVY